MAGAVSDVWKEVERRVAGFFGARRNPLSGGNSGHTRSDSLHGALFIETKYRKRWEVLGIWRFARDCARQENKIPLVCLAEKGKPGFWILVHSNDLTAVANQRLIAKTGNNNE